MTDEKIPSLLYLWDKRTLYIGPLSEKLRLSQGAATLSLALDKPISFICKGMDKPITCRSLLLPAGFSVTVDTQDAVIANCNLDALGCDFFALSQRMEKNQSGVAYDLKNEKQFIKEFINMHMARKNSQAAFEQLDEILAYKGEAQYKVDPRVVSVVEHIKQTVDDNLSVEDLASLVNLSVPRLVQLFKQQTGVPMRRFRLWHRLYVTAVKMGKGESLTQAAISAGFTDSSHFSHTFRDMLGMSPTAVFAQPNELKIMVPDNVS